MRSVSSLCVISSTWESSQVDVSISREFRTLPLLIDLNKQNDFTPCQSPLLCHPFVEFSFSKSGFLAWTEHLSGFTALRHQVGGFGESASLENFPSRRRRVCLFVPALCFYPCLIRLLSARIKNIHSTKVSWALSGKCKDPSAPSLGDLCVTEENTRKQFFFFFFCIIVKWSLFFCRMI